MTTEIVPTSKPEIIPAGKPEVIPAGGTQLSSLERKFANLTDEALAEFEALERIADVALKDRHAVSTATNYDYWWGRFLDWCEHPERRRLVREIPSVTFEDLAELGPNHAHVEGLMMAWLKELAFGGADTAEAIAEYFEEDNGLSPNTFHSVIAALKARSKDQFRQKWNPSDLAETKLQGMRARLRRHWGKDSQATPLLGTHVAAIARVLAEQAHQSHNYRDLLIAELSAAGLTPAEIGRLGPVCIADPGDVIAKTAKANEELFTATGQVGIRSLIVLGQNRKGGKQDPTKLIPLGDDAPLLQVLRSYERTERQRPRSPSHPDHRVLLTGFAHQQRSNLMRQVLVGLAKKAGSDWQPSRSEPAMPADVLEAVRASLRDSGLDGSQQQAVTRRAKRDMAMVWIGFYACLRRSELLALTVDDLVPVEGMHRYVAEIRTSKTDQAALGASLVIPGDAERPAHADPVRCIIDWFAELKEMHGGTLTGSTPLFPAITPDGKPREGAMGAQAFSDRLRLLAERADLKRLLGDAAFENISGHSLRRGYITTAAMLQRSPLEIQQQSRHQDLNVLARYVEQVGRRTADVIINPEDFMA